MLTRSPALGKYETGERAEARLLAGAGRARHTRYGNPAHSAAGFESDAQAPVRSRAEVARTAAPAGRCQAILINRHAPSSRRGSQEAAA